MEAAQQALERGQSVLIDRTNVTPVSGRCLMISSVESASLQVVSSRGCIACMQPGMACCLHFGELLACSAFLLTIPLLCPACLKDQRRPFIAVARQKGVPVRLCLHAPRLLLHNHLSALALLGRCWFWIPHGLQACSWNLRFPLQPG